MFPTAIPFPPLYSVSDAVNLLYQQLPLSLTVSRFVLAPMLVVLASCNASGSSLASICLLAFLTDLFDGILARRLGIATPALRRLDVLADIVFYLAVLAAFCQRRSEVVRDYGWFFGGFISAEALCQAISFFRFGQTSATHTYLNKAWAVVLCITCMVLFWDVRASLVMPVALTLGILAYLEVLLILLTAEQPPIDVPTIWHQWQRRKAFLHLETEQR
jgi:CDP-diacylglycerol--glycerol-3-phosphate 3-phosphatidyltransferase